VLAAGGVRPGNVTALVEETGVREVHLRAPADDGNGRDRTSAGTVVAVLAAVGRGQPDPGNSRA
jgi:copper homeostasis protein